MVAQVVATGFHALWCHIFVVEWQWDLQGLGLASTLTSFILLATTMMYTHCLSYLQEALFWPEASVWSDWSEYFSLGLPTTGIVAAVFLALEFLALVSGNLGVLDQANMMISMQIAAVLAAACLGF